MKDYFKLDKYIIPKIVPSIYRIGLILCIILGLIKIIENTIIKTFFYTVQHSWGDVLLSGILWIVIIPIILRIICEVLLMLYEINQTLLGIKSNLSPQDEK